MDVRLRGRRRGKIVRHCVVSGCPRSKADVIDKNGTVIDMKTSSKKPGSISASDALQLTTYGLLAGKRETRLITLARTKTPSCMAAGSMQSGLYLPNRGSNLCSRKHCAFWRECQAEYGGAVE